MSVLKGLEPQKVFYYFEEISKIPRGSGNEKAVSDYCVKVAKENNLETYQDKLHNVIIYKEASKGYEESETVILQGHLDMVNEKNNDSKHNFDKDPLKLFIEEDFIGAKGTSLGGDNGVAIAYGLAIASSNDLEHPALEIVFTADEEEGMKGAIELDSKKISGSKLINLDSASEGVFVAGCAGGMKIEYRIPITWEIRSNPITMVLAIKGLKGGHSGIDINKQRASSNILLFRLLGEIKKTVDVQLAQFIGGDKDNAIARESYAVICVRQDDFKKLDRLVENLEADIKKEYEISDPKLELMFQEIKDEYSKTLSDETFDTLIDLALLSPTGVWTMDLNLKDLVETSNNLGSVLMDDEEIKFAYALRSSSLSRREELFSILERVANLTKTEIKVSSEYPAWQFNPDSELLAKSKEIYKKVYKEDAKVEAIHAGLECGLFAEKFPELDMVSFGPTMYDNHTPDERLSISSTRRIWTLLIEILKDLK